MSKQRVLIVEDEPPIARLVALIVQQMGLEAVTADNGAEALVELEKAKPDLVILDLILPVMKGEDVIQEIQGNPDWADIPIVLMSTRQSAQGYKKDEFPLIAKPFKPEDVKAMVRQVLDLP